MKTSLLALSALGLLFVMSCGKGGNVNLGPSGPGGNTGSPQSWQTEINRSQCQMTTPKDATIIGLWRAHQTLRQMTRDIGLFVTATQTTLSFTCAAPKVTPRTATVQSPSAIQGNKLAIVNIVPTERVGDRTLLCDACLNQGQRAYKITGDCLTIEICGTTYTLGRSTMYY